MAEQKTLRAIARLLSYPDDQTVEAAELLYIILQSELPESAKDIARFGAYLEQHECWELEELFTRTFDVSPACALEVGWHLFGEEYTRGLFLVRMRQELRKYGLPESTELPDHIVHVLSIVAEMPSEEAGKFVRACVLPAASRMQAALEKIESPYAAVLSCLVAVLHRVWGEGEMLVYEMEQYADGNAIPEGVDLLHAFPVADVKFGCGDGCGHSVSSPDLVQLSLNGTSDRRKHP